LWLLPLGVWLLPRGTGPLLLHAHGLVVELVVAIVLAVIDHGDSLPQHPIRQYSLQHTW
jgi:hypothetical protein